MVVKLLLPRVPQEAKTSREAWIDTFNQVADQNNRILKAMSVWKNPKRRLTYRLAHIQGFQRIKISNLQVGQIHQGQVLYCRIATTVMIQDAKSMLIEDESGICELAVYHLRKKKLKRDQFIAILEPNYRRRLDGSLRVQVDDPSDLVLDFEPPPALLEGLSRIIWGNKQDESRLTNNKTVDASTASVGNESFVDLEAQSSKLSETQEEKKGDETENASCPIDGDDISVDFGHFDGEDDAILVAAKAAPIGMPTIREDEEEESMEPQPVDTHSETDADRVLGQDVLEADVSDQLQKLSVTGGNVPQEIAVIPLDEPSETNISSLLSAVNGLISNQKLLMEAVFGKEGNQKN